MNYDKHVERVDALTGCANLLSFLETFSTRLASETGAAFSLLLIDLNNFGAFNTEHGHAKGDGVLHWVSIVLRDTGFAVYRIGGDEFLVLFDQGNREERNQLAQSVFERINREGKQFNFDRPASVMLIHFQDEQLEIADLWVAISDALFDVKIYGERGFLVNTYAHASAFNNYQLRVINMLTERLLSFANRLDATHQIAYLDPVTHLPNSLAAERELNQILEGSQHANKVFSILFIDGDNLRFYNDISYSAGDSMLGRLADLLSSYLRPGDFIARWRVGDEFLVLLPETTPHDAFVVAERLRSEVESKSKAWEIPITISIGISTYPFNGTTVEELLLAVEKAAKQSKDSGKNKTTAFE
ncbi:MAG TPA: GGDEF domain-containing protein [Anaerolineales bacterium]|nr:GGDEF domain-containing protein [Anaerolineales bacterium]